MSEWVAFKDREPTEADLPVVACNKIDFNCYCFNYVAPRAGEKWTHWHPLPAPPTSKPKVFLRHHDGREEEILEPVYVFPSDATQDLDEILQNNQWLVSRRQLSIRPQDIGTIRRRIN